MKHISLKNMKRLSHFKDPKAFMTYLIDMKNVYNSTEKFNLRKEQKVLVVFDDTIADMISNKKLH